jgi:hypothetical protein
LHIDLRKRKEIDCEVIGMRKKLMESETLREKYLHKYWHAVAVTTISILTTVIVFLIIVLIFMKLIT